MAESSGAYLNKTDYTKRAPLADVAGWIQDH